MTTFTSHVRTIVTGVLLLVLAVAATATAVAQLPVRSRDVQLISNNNTNYTSLQSVNGQTSDWTLVLPPTAGATGSLITTSVSGSTATASWLAPGTDGQALIITGGVPAWGTPASGWLLLGNATTDPLVNFIGTTDAQPLVVRTNNSERIRVLSTGEVGIGTSTPLTNARVSIATIPATTGRGIDIDMATQADIQGVRIRNLGAPGTDGAGLVIGSAANGTGTGIRIGSITPEVLRPNIGIAVQATSNGYTFVPNASGAAIAYRAGNTANADRPRIGFEAYTRGTAGADAVAVRGNANATNSVTSYGIGGHFLTEGTTGNLWPLLVSSANNNDVYLGSSAADVPAVLSTIVGSTNANTTYMFNARMSGNATFVGSTSGTVSLVAPAVAGTQAYTLPGALPVANNHVMVSTTGGIMSWADPASLVGNVFWSLGGNAVASAQNLGTTSNFALPIITNNVERMRINATGEVGIGTTAAAGYSLHVGGTAGTPNVRLASVGGAAVATAWTPTANDGVITADNNGDLSKRTAQAVVNAGLSGLSGTVNLTAGSTSIVVPNTNVAATSRIVVTYEDASAAGFVATMVTTRVVGASFTVAFSGPIPAGATGRLHYIIVNP